MLIPITNGREERTFSQRADIHVYIKMLQQYVGKRNFVLLQQILYGLNYLFYFVAILG